MKRNPFKYQAIVMGRIQTMPKFYCETTTIPNTEELEMLRVTVDDKIKFEKHIDSICRKVSQQVVVLKRMKKILPLETGKCLHLSFTIPHFNYCSETWHFCNKGATAKLFLALSLHNFSLKGRDFVFEETTCQNGYVISASLRRMKLNEAGLLVNETGIDRTKTISLLSSTGSLSLCLFILSGDIALNPGPKYHYPCGARSKPVKVNQKGVQCDSCDAWFHTKC